MLIGGCVDYEPVTRQLLTPARRPWTKGEEQQLAKLANHSAGYVALKLERSVWSVKRKASELGISLRTPGIRRGLVVGQPRGMRLASEVRGGMVRNLILSGKVDVTAMLARLALDVRGATELCPRCASRPVTVKRTGLCGVCHKYVLIEALQAELAVLEARKEQQVIWQRTSRLRKSLKADLTAMLAELEAS